MNRADKTTALVTGAGRGIGRAVATTLARHGVSILAIDVVESSARSLASSLTSEGYRAVGVEADVTDVNAVLRALDIAEAQLGLVTAVVNNAGIVSLPLAEDLPLDEWRRVIDVNLTGPFLVSQLVARRLIFVGEGGAIVNIASIQGLRTYEPELYSSDPSPRFDGVAYTASKAGVIQLTRSLARAWAGFGIRVNSVSPGPVDTDLVRTTTDEAMRQRMVARIPLGRLATVDDVAKTVVYLLSEAAAFVTGENVVVDGGFIL